eukprot:GHVL01005525.1.p1 GENE.GHVL01005525.1~~GHVL01005525.1.p1  ORF type:complete len:321 (-),score=58.02 GHVL01005525.1:92-1054(-)
MGIALCRAISLTNHSCLPNVEIDYKNNKIAHVHAIRDIIDGEQIFQSYIDEDEPIQIRQSCLLQEFGFTCCCSKCKSETLSILIKEREKLKIEKSSSKELHDIENLISDILGVPCEAVAEHLDENNASVNYHWHQSLLKSLDNELLSSDCDSLSNASSQNCLSNASSQNCLSNASSHFNKQNISFSTDHLIDVQVVDDVDGSKPAISRSKEWKSKFDENIQSKVDLIQWINRTSNIILNEYNDTSVNDSSDSNLTDDISINSSNDNIFGNEADDSTSDTSDNLFDMLAYVTDSNRTRVNGENHFNKSLKIMCVDTRKDLL